MSGIIRLGLDRVRRALALLGNPEEGFASVIITGTNGKGAVSAMAASIFQAAGLRAGLYTSPHLVDERERVRVDGAMVSAADWRRAKAEVSGLDRRHRLELTEFELLTVAAFLHFHRAGVELAALEVGLGGRLDAVNAVAAPEACVITSIGLDHRDWLGPRLEDVYFEKRGVARPGAPLLQDAPPRLRADGTRALAAAGVPVLNRGRDFKGTPRSVDWKRCVQTVDARLGAQTWRGLKVPILGAPQAGNAALAAALADALRRRGWPIDERAVRRGLAAVRWPGRFQILRRGGRGVILDGAHNPQAAGALARTYAASPWRRRRAAVIFGCMKDKDARAIARRLAPLAGAVYAVPVRSRRGRSAEDAARAWPRGLARAYPGFDQAWAAARGWKKGPVLVTGSLYLVGEAMEKWGLTPR